MSNPLFSIITATYNHENFILDCIQSVKNQTIANWEMIIVNDGSTDKTAQIVREAIKSDRRIKFFDEVNVGIFNLEKTYNLALKNSTGKYICILEGDDVWEKDKLDRQKQILEKDENVVLAWGRAFRKNSDLSDTYDLQPDTEEKTITEKFFNNPEGKILDLLYIRNYIPALTVTIRKKVLEEIGGFLQTHNLPLVDFPTILVLSTKGKFYYDEKPLGSWRVNPKQITKTYPIEITEGFYQASIDHYDSLPIEIKQRLSITKEKIHSNFLDIIHVALARSGRYKLIRKDYKSARKDYLKAIFFKSSGNHMWRLRSMIGLLFSFFKLDVEWLAGLLGKSTFKSK